MKANEYKIGDAVEIRLGSTDEGWHWEKCTLISVFPRIIKFPNGIVSDLSIGIIMRKDPDAPKPEKTMRNIPLDEEHKLFKIALVKIIKEGDTTRPNATVKRMVNHAKEALGEIPI